MRYLKTDPTPSADTPTIVARDVLASEGRAAMLKALDELIAAGDAAQRHQPWDITMPAGLSTTALAQPFDERLDGLAIREVAEQSVFKRFFGR